MAYLAPTANAGLILADPLTIQPFETTNVNSNFTKIDSAFGLDRARLVTLEATSVPKVASAAARDALFPVPALGNRVFRTDKGYEQTYYTATLGVAAAGWYVSPGAILYSAIGSLNPIPVAATDISGSAKTFTLGTGEYAQLTVEFNASFQMNVAMSVTLAFYENLASNFSIVYNGPAIDKLQMSKSKSFVAGPGNHDFKLVASASGAGASVLYETSYRVVTQTPAQLA